VRDKHSSAIPPAMGLDDVEIQLLLSLYMVLIQALFQSKPTVTRDDDIACNGGVGTLSMLHSEHVQIAMSTAALYDYRLASGLLCFDDGLRYWVKPRCTVWFSDFLMAMYDSSRWIENFRMDKRSVAEITFRL
jgi:hypothetical protein